MKSKYRSWIPGIVFWTLFIASFALAGGHSWVDSAWLLVGRLLLLILAVWSVVAIFRHRRSHPRIAAQCTDGLSEFGPQAFKQRSPTDITYSFLDHFDFSKLDCGFAPCGLRISASSDLFILKELPLLGICLLVP